jgi:hypothetical protein
MPVALTKTSRVGKYDFAFLLLTGRHDAMPTVSSMVYQFDQVDLKSSVVQTSKEVKLQIRIASSPISNIPTAIK